MKKELPEKVDSSFWGRVKKFFKDIFVFKKTKKICSDNLKTSKETRSDTLNASKETIEDLQKEYEAEKIFASDMSEEQYESLVTLYTDQIKDIKQKIIEKEKNIYKNIV